MDTSPRPIPTLPSNDNPTPSGSPWKPLLWIIIPLLAVIAWEAFATLTGSR